MLVELRVTNLGVIADQTIVLGPGLTALTGETGAGKTLIVDAISLLTGAPSDPAVVAPGAHEARVEARFETGGAEMILARAVPAAGRTRCYLDGRMVSVTQLAELGRTLVDIHGQHAHQSLLSPAAQKASLDRAGRIDTSELDGWRRRVRELTEARHALGGDPRERARQIDLLSYQLGEIDGAGLDDPEEDRLLTDEEELLADAAGLIETSISVWQALAGDDGIVERLGTVASTASGRKPLSELHDRLLGLQEELSDVAALARRLSESVEDDPERLAHIGERRRVLTELRRKYGPTLSEVIVYREELRRQVTELVGHDQRAAGVQAEMERAEKELAAAAERLWEARRAAAPVLARSVEAELRTLAMPRARFGIDIGPDPAHESVTWLLAANPGQPMLPLAKVASGGELARAMLATRLVVGPAWTGTGPPGTGPAGTGAAPADRDEEATLVFDEVDAGIGGEAAIAVGRALAALGSHHQVLVVTHLAQVAAFASQHLSVTKEVVRTGGEERTVATARPVLGESRVIELARMLSGRPDSDSARRHAGELLAAATSAIQTAVPSYPSPNSRRRRR